MAGVDSQQTKEAETSSLLHTTGSITEEIQTYMDIKAKKAHLLQPIPNLGETIPVPAQTHLQGFIWGEGREAQDILPPPSKKREQLLIIGQNGPKMQSKRS